MITVLYAVDNIFVYRRFRSNKKLSNSDKPRDAFVQYAMAWLTPKHATPHMCDHGEFGRSTSKGMELSPKIGARWVLMLLRTGNVPDPL